MKGDTKCFDLCKIKGMLATTEMEKVVNATHFKGVRELSFRYVNFELSARNSSRTVGQAVGYVHLKFVRELWVGSSRIEFGINQYG